MLSCFIVLFMKCRFWIKIFSIVTIKLINLDLKLNTYYIWTEKKNQWHWKEIQWHWKDYKQSQLIKQQQNNNSLSSKKKIRITKGCLIR